MRASPPGENMTLQCLEGTGRSVCVARGGRGRKIFPESAALAPPGRGGNGAARSGEQHRGLLRGPGRRRAAGPHSLPGRRSGLLRVPGGRLRQALHLLHGGPARCRADQQAGRQPTPRNCSPTTSRRSCARSASRAPTSPGSPSAPRPACGWRRSTRSLVKSLSLHSGWTGDRPVPPGRRAGLADHGEGARQHHRHGDPGHLPLVLHPGAVRGEAGVHRLPRRLRAQPSDAAGGRLPAPVGRRARARRDRRAQPHPGADARSPSGSTTR